MPRVAENCGHLSGVVGTVLPVTQEQHPTDIHDQVPVPGLGGVLADAGIVHLLGALNAAGVSTRGSCQGNRLCDLAGCSCRLGYVVIPRHEAAAAHKVLMSLAAEISDPLARRFLAGEMFQLYGEALLDCAASYSYDTASSRVSLSHSVYRLPDGRLASDLPVLALHLPAADMHQLDVAAGGTAPAPPARNLRRPEMPPLPTAERELPRGWKPRDGVICVATRRAVHLVSDPENALNLYGTIEDAAKHSGMLSPELATFLEMCDSLPQMLGTARAGIGVSAYIAGKESGDWKLDHDAYVSPQPRIHVEVGASPHFDPRLTDPNGNYSARLFGR